MKKYFTLFVVSLFGCAFLQAQEEIRTFKDTRVINTHSVEVLQKRKLDIRIGHRFGDLAGANGGWSNFYGLENAADVMIGAEYGVTDKFTVGLYRSKGAGDLKALVNPLLKYKLVQQADNGSPVTVTALTLGTISTMKKNPESTGVSSFPEFSHRMAYAIQVMMARKFADRFSLQVIPSFTHRNLVDFEDNNNVISLGFASRVQLTKVMAFVADFTLPVNGLQSPFSENPEGFEYFPALGIGMEWDTGGHVFQLNLTNAEGIMETDYIPNTTTNWLDGEFRIGFTISRLFNL